MLFSKRTQHSTTSWEGQNLHTTNKVKQNRRTRVMSSQNNTDPRIVANVLLMKSAGALVHQEQRKYEAWKSCQTGHVCKKLCGVLGNCFTCRIIPDLVELLRRNVNRTLWQLTFGAQNLTRLMIIWCFDSWKCLPKTPMTIPIYCTTQKCMKEWSL